MLKQAGIYVCVALSVYSSLAVGREGSYIAALVEINDPNGRFISGRLHTAGASMEEYTDHGRMVVYYGASMLRMDASIMISEYGNPYTMYPMYGYTGFMPDWKIAPFAEVGLDLIDVFLDNGSEGDSVAVDSTVDAYIAGGVKIELTESVMVSAYMRQYHIRPYILPSSRFNVLGAALFIRL